MAARPISGGSVGHYRLLERIGEGGMGVVYRAHDEHLQRDVALKLLPHTVVSSDSAKRRFRKEALTLARLNHPNIETLYGFESYGDIDFLIMEYVPGITLASKLARGPLRESELLEYAIQLASALEEAHQQGVVHRDIKPANILLAASGPLKMLDFGLARFLSAQGDTDTATDRLAVAGTLPYVAPEQLSEGQEYDERSDLYSCGVVLYEMATGKRPHAETSVASLLRAILEREPTPTRTLNPAISPDLEGIIRKAMDKDRALRYQSARELKVDLQRLVSGKKLEHLPRPTRAATRSWLTRALLVLLVLLVGLEVVTWRWRSRSGSTAAAAPRVVAVLPIDAVGGNPENQVLCRGLTNLLTTRLAQISHEYGVEVVPASEVRTNGVNSIETARQKLGVTMVVEGSWDFASNQVMYSLVDAQSRRSVNADYVKANLNDIASVELGVADNLLKMVAGHFGSDHGAEANATESHPDAYQYYVRGVGYLDDYQKESSLQAAVTLFGSALERNPSFAPALAGMGEAYWRLYQETKDASSIPKAVDACNRARSFGDKLSQVHTTLGLIDQGQGKDQEAVQEFKRALEIDATSDSAYRGLATAYESLGKSAEAEAAYKQAIDIRKNYWGGYSALGAFYAKHAKYDDAASQFQHVIELAPENVRGYTNLAAVYLLQGKIQQAEELLRKSLGIEPNYRAYSNLGALLFTRKQYGESARMYESALKLNDRDARVWGSQADAYYWSGDRQKAATAYAKAVELQQAALKTNPTDPTLLSQLALWQSMLGERQKSVALLKQALSRSPDDPEILFRGAEIHDQNGDQTAALTWLEKAVQAGYPFSRIEQDPTLQNLRDNIRYQQLQKSAPPQTAAK